MSSTLIKPDIQYDEAVLAAVHAAIIAVQRDTGYGSIEVTVHDGRVTQIERREKVRFEPSKPKK
ncbi:MAG TPA: YezD family protein [Methylophilus sp.]|nr:YezD family protein [Methylophilus sp.]